MNPLYRWYIDAIGYDGGRQRREVRPVYKDDAAIEWSQEKGQEFLRKSLNGNLTFLREDYDFIMSQPFVTKYILTVELSPDGGRTYSPWAQFSFTQTDCTITPDDRMLDVKPDTYDEYTNILSGMEKEFDLIQLKVPTDAVTLDKRPLLQVYVKGQNKLTNILSNMSWEVSTNGSDYSHDTLVNTFKFYRQGIYKVLGINSYPDSYNFNGIYVGKMQATEFLAGFEMKLHGELSCVGSQAYIVIDAERTILNGKWTYTTEIVRKSDGSVVSSEKIESGSSDIGPINDSRFFTETTWHVYTRLMCDVDSVGVNETYQVPEEDIVAQNLNYRRVIGYSISSIYISGNASISPSEYGKRPDGQYYLTPYNPARPKFTPVGQSYWVYGSLWANVTQYLDEAVETSGRKGYTLRNAYSLGWVIKRLVAEIAPEIAFDGTAEYSRFLFGGTEPLCHMPLSLYMTPKSNILAGEYSQAAQKAPVTLQSVLEMLAKAYKCYWFVDERRRLRLEHVWWFRNGGSYTSSAHEIGTDLTQLRCLNNGKAWSFGTSQYSFDKIDMAQYYTWKWMDDVTEPFTGTGIEMTAPTITEGKKEETSIADFTTDIDYMLASPDDCSKDGFALMNVAGGRIAYWQTLYPGTSSNVTLQNGYLSMWFLLPNYLAYDMPSYFMKVNGVNDSAASVGLQKKQKVQLPYFLSPDTNKLIRTSIGDGRIGSASVRLTSGMADITLKYPTQ